MKSAVEFSEAYFHVFLHNSAKQITNHEVFWSSHQQIQQWHSHFINIEKLFIG